MSKNSKKRKVRTHSTYSINEKGVGSISSSWLYEVLCWLSKDLGGLMFSDLVSEGQRDRYKEILGFISYLDEASYRVKKIKLKTER
jgi:hypothetical protein